MKLNNERLEEKLEEETEREKKSYLSLDSSTIESPSRLISRGSSTNIDGSKTLLNLLDGIYLYIYI